MPNLNDRSLIRISAIVTFSLLVGLCGTVLASAPDGYGLPASQLSELLQRQGWVEQTDAAGNRLFSPPVASTIPTVAADSTDRGNAFTGIP